MAFSVSLTASGGVPSPPTGDDVTGEPEDYSTSVMKACEDVSARTTCRFVLGGFGKADWALDLGYDLSTFVEELPDLASAVRAAEEFELNLYGQGVEQILRFQPDGAQVVITCVSGTNWIPDPATETIALPVLDNMLTQLAKDFATALQHADSHVADREPFVSWRRGDF
ncbi:hypothetical protein [Kribbella endophytica]